MTELDRSSATVGILEPTIFLSWINITVTSILEALWYIGWCPPPPDGRTSTTSPTPPPKPQTVTCNETKEPSFWALAIGVDKYKDSRVGNLTGCVADSNNFVDFLTMRMGVPTDHIKILHDQHATRQAVKSSIAALAKDDRIHKGDPIAIFYAGHGAQARPPAGWPTGSERDPRIQMICTHDFVPATTGDENGQGIPDITLSVLLSELADAKGNNVTVVFDCCHSGSGTRTDQLTPDLFIRGVVLPGDYKVLDTIDEDLLRHISDNERKVIISKNFKNAGTASHVLLAACSSKETAKESGRHGHFTYALLSLLRSSALDTLTYQDVISRMDDLPGQAPQCDGVYSSRILFNNKIPNAGRVLYRVTADPESGTVSLEAGEAQGISKGATFDVFDSADINAKKLGSIFADKPLACSTIMSAGETKILSPAWAIQTRVGEGFDIAIALPVESLLLPVLVRVVQEMEDRRPTKRNLRLVDLKNPPEHEVAVYNESDNAVFELTDQAWVTEGLKRLSRKVPLDQLDHLYTVFSGLADFFYHLRRSSKAQQASYNEDLLDSRSLSAFEVKKQRLHGDGSKVYTEPLLMPVLKDGKPIELNCEGIIRINVLEDRRVNYGLKILSNCEQSLYVWAFAFNMSDMSIVTIYQPTFAKQRENGSSQADPSIPPFGELTIGYGSGGARPMAVEMGDHEDVDVSYIKFFMTTKYVDLSMIEQQSPFLRKRKIVGGSAARKLYDTLLVTVVTKKVRLAD